jgi:hypothetical protein
MKNTLILLAAFLLLFVFRSSAQEGPFQSSGIGVIVPEKGVNAMYLNFPLAEIELYVNPGQKCGIIYKKNGLNLMYKVSSTAFRVDNKDLAETECAGYCLKYFERKGDLVKVLVNTTEKGLWISLTELNYLRFVPRTWMDIFIDKKTFFFSQVGVGINLRSEPDQKSKKITLLKGNHYAISLTGKTEGLWAEVNVGHYDNFPCSAKTSSQKPSEERNGWIKVIDDAGYPNIWFYPHGCK